MDIPREDLERLMAIESTRELAMAEYKRNPNDPENLMKLGRALVELSQFAQGPDSSDMLEDAVSKLEAAVKADPKKHEAHWWLGNALTTQAFQVTDPAKAGAYFDQASSCFRIAIKEDPSNEAYRKSLEVSIKGPEIHQEFQKQMAIQQAVAGGGMPSGGEPARGAKTKKRNYDLYYDIAGWVILGVAIVAWVSLVSSRTAVVAAPK